MKIFGSKHALLIIATIFVILLILFFVTSKRRKRRNLADLALEEHAAWNFGNTKESNAAMKHDLSKYWRAAGAPDYGDSAAWSAAFISWLFKVTGAKEKFPYASSHSVYIRQAVANRKAGMASGGIIGYRKEEYPPKIGDLICYPRQGGVTFDSNYTYKSHCDLVVDIDRRNRKLVTIGGNVSNSVSKTLYDIDEKGRVITPKVHAILRNRI